VTLDAPHSARADERGVRWRRDTDYFFYLTRLLCRETSWVAQTQQILSSTLLSLSIYQMRQ
jgi:hypothetical protein